MMENEQVTLLWTGGWDSTFRLLQLLLDTNLDVQPLYLVDEKRASTLKEIDAMQKIRDMIEEDMPEVSDRLLPTEYGNYRGTVIEPHYREWRDTLKERGRVGGQYPVLASYAEQNGIERLENGVFGSGFLGEVLRDCTVRQTTHAGEVAVLKENAEGAVKLFEHFSFPLLGQTKLDMKEEAERRGWMPIMRETWFCYNPTLGLPCGSCQPCKVTHSEGMGDRVGHLGPFFFTFVRPRWRAAAILQNLGLKSTVKSILGYADGV